MADETMEMESSTVTTPPTTEASEDEVPTATIAPDVVMDQQQQQQRPASIESLTTSDTWTESKCVFCRQELNDGTPKLLPCFHGACASCISDRDAALRCPTDLLRCAVCQQEFAAADIIDNFFIRDVAANPKKTSDNMAPSCTSCEDNANATSFCTDCGEWLCDACVLAHQRVRVTKDHVIQSKSDAENARPTTVVHQSLYCPIHKQEPLKLFCETCDLLTCRDCQLTGHREHKYQFVSEACQWQKQQFQEVIVRVKEQKNLLLEANKSTQIVLDQMLERENYIHERIKQFAMMYINEIGQRSRILVKDLHTVCDQKKLELNASSESISGVVSKMDHTVNFVETALKEGSDLALLYSKRTLLKQLQSLQYVHFGAPPHPRDVDLRFVYDEQRLTGEIQRSGVLAVGDRVLRLPSNYHTPPVNNGPAIIVPPPGPPSAAIQGTPGVGPSMAHGHPPPLRSVVPDPSSSAPSSSGRPLSATARQSSVCPPNCPSYPAQTALQEMVHQINSMVPSNQLVSSSTATPTSHHQQSNLQQRNSNLWDLLDKGPMSAPVYRPRGPSGSHRGYPPQYQQQQHQQQMHHQQNGQGLGPHSHQQNNKPPGPHSQQDRASRQPPQQVGAQQPGSSQGYSVRGHHPPLGQGRPGQITLPTLPPPPPGYPNPGSVCRDYTRNGPNGQNAPMVNGPQMPSIGAHITSVQQHQESAPTNTQMMGMLPDCAGSGVPPSINRSFIMRPAQMRPHMQVGMMPSGQHPPATFQNQPQQQQSENVNVACPPIVSLVTIPASEMHNHQQHMMQHQQRQQLLQQQQFYSHYSSSNNNNAAVPSPPARSGMSVTMTAVPSNILVSSGTQKLSHYPTPPLKCGVTIEPVPPNYRTVVHHTNSVSDNLAQRPQSQIWMSGMSIIPRPPPSNTTSPAPSLIPWAPSPQSAGASHDSDCSQDSQRTSQTDSNPKKDNVTSTNNKSVADNVKVKSEKLDANQDVDMTNKVLESMDKLLATLRTDASQEAADLLSELTNDGGDNAQKQKPDSSSSPGGENGKKSTTDMEIDESPEIMPATPPPPKIPVIVTLDDDGNEHVDEGSKEEVPARVEKEIEMEVQAPADSEAAPALSESATAHSEAVTAHSEAVTAHSEAAPADLEASTAESDAAPARVVDENQGPSDIASKDIPEPVAAGTEEDRESDPNEDWCAVCHDGGDLLCCGNCPRVYHLECHVPPLPSVPKEEDNWHCLMCTDLSKVPDDDDADGKRKAISGLCGKELQLCQRILLEVFCHEASPPFHDPVSTVDVPNYYKVVSQPMDLETVKCKLASNSYDYYSAVDEFLHDMHLIFTNCCFFNDKKSDLHIAGKKLEIFLNELVATFLPRFAKGSSSSSSSSGDGSKQRIKRKKVGDKTPAPIHIW